MPEGSRQVFRPSGTDEGRTLNRNPGASGGTVSPFDTLIRPEEGTVEKSKTKNSKILNKEIISLWMSLLLSILVTSAVSLAAMMIITYAIGYRARELVFAAIVVFLVIIGMVAVVWIKYWDMTKYIYRPGAEIISAGESGAVVPSEIVDPASAIVRSLAVVWVIMIISIAAVLVLNMLVRDYFIL